MVAQCLAASHLWISTRPSGLKMLGSWDSALGAMHSKMWARSSGLPSLFHFSAAFLLFFLSAAGAFAASAQAKLRPIGVAKVDVTPAEPIRLTGYAVRKTNSVGVEQKLWAKALAIGADSDGPAVLITLDNCGIAEGNNEAATLATLVRMGHLPATQSSNNLVLE